VIIAIQNGEDIKGKVIINLNKGGKRVDHLGIRVELLGTIENVMEKGQSAYQFLSLVKDLEPPGSLTDNISYDFGFSRVEMPYETFAGISHRTRYLISVVINRNYGKVTQEEDFLVHNPIPSELIEENIPISMNIGLTGHLQLEVHFDHSKYHLKDIITGYF
jgi:vacuolar protein sorting-associated protein 26